MKKIPLSGIVGGVLTVGLVGMIIYGSVNGNGTSDNAVTTEPITVTTAQTTPAQTTTEATTTEQKSEEETRTMRISISGKVGYNKDEICPGEYTVCPTSNDAYYFITDEGDYDSYTSGPYYYPSANSDVTHITKNTKIELTDGNIICLNNAFVEVKVNLANKSISEATIGEMNALEKACSYLMYTHFSYTGLIKQLEYEGFTEKEAEFGADNVGIDWNEQAAGKARDYLNYSAFSREGLRSQLEYEGFTDSQIDYALSAVGY